MKENKANKKGREAAVGNCNHNHDSILYVFFYVLYCSNNKYMTREEKAIHGLFVCRWLLYERTFLSIICPENGNIIRMHFLRRRMIWINIIFVIFLLGNMVEWNLETVGEVRMGVVHTG